MKGPGGKCCCGFRSLPITDCTSQGQQGSRVSLESRRQGHAHAHEGKPCVTAAPAATGRGGAAASAGMRVHRAAEADAGRGMGEAGSGGGHWGDGLPVELHGRQVQEQEEQGGGEYTALNSGYDAAGGGGQRGVAGQQAQCAMESGDAQLLPLHPRVAGSSGDGRSAQSQASSATGTGMPIAAAPGSEGTPANQVMHDDVVTVTTSNGSQGGVGGRGRGKRAGEIEAAEAGVRVKSMECELTGNELNSRNAFVEMQTQKGSALKRIRLTAVPVEHGEMRE